MFHGELLLRSARSELPAFAGNEPCPCSKTAAKVQLFSETAKQKRENMKKNFILLISSVFGI
jgi:hypothetical protein